MEDNGINPSREIEDRDRIDIIFTNPLLEGEEKHGILSSFPEDKQTAETALLFIMILSSVSALLSTKR